MLLFFSVDIVIHRTGLGWIRQCVAVFAIVLHSAGLEWIGQCDAVFAVALLSFVARRWGRLGILEY